jgi:N-acetylmuramoyl-L-alanine amidase
MAYRFSRGGGCGYGTIATALAALALMLVTVGCAGPSPEQRAAARAEAAHSPSIMVESLPSPNFDGPEVGESPAAPPVASFPLLPAHGDKDLAGIPRDWVPTARANTWKWIVIHHSATPTGGAVAFDKMHKSKGWDELGYHFVIGNGTDTRDGQVEVGGRWPLQKWGAHAKTPDNRYNDFGIGVCLVGNFDLTRPTDQQVRSLSKLVAFLMHTYHIPADRVVGHGDTGKATECPGRLMNVAQVRRLSTQILVDAGEAVTPDAGPTQTAGLELLTSPHH